MKKIKIYSEEILREKIDVALLTLVINGEEFSKHLSLATFCSRDLCIEALCQVQRASFWQIMNEEGKVN